MAADQPILHPVHPNDHPLSPREQSQPIRSRVSGRRLKVNQFLNEFGGLPQGMKGCKDFQGVAYADNYCIKNINISKHSPDMMTPSVQHTYELPLWRNLDNFLRVSTC